MPSHAKSNLFDQVATDRAEALRPELSNNRPFCNVDPFGQPGEAMKSTVHEIVSSCSLKQNHLRLVNSVNSVNPASHPETKTSTAREFQNWSSYLTRFTTVITVITVICDDHN